MASRIHWKTKRSRLVHKNPWYQIYLDDVIRPDGNPGKYYVVKTKGPSVFIVAVNERKEICLIRIHRYPTQMISVEVPAGNSEGEAPLRAAKRELEEETGLRAKKWRHIGKWQPMNGILQEIGHVFLATDLYRFTDKFDEQEGISEIRFIPYKKVLKMIFNGGITDGQSMVSLLLAAERLGWLKTK